MSTPILIVDDDAPFAQTLRLILEDAGYVVEVAPTVSEGRARILENRWDVILLDQRLDSTEPEGGISLALECRLQAPGAKVIMVTANANAAAIRRAFDAGVFDYVEKTPVLSTLLIARLRNALALVRERRLASLASKEIEKAILANWTEALASKDSNRKGALLEEVIADLFRTIPGFEEVQRNRKNEIEEIDVLVRNASPDEFWKKEGNYILIECKHWSKPAGKPEAVAFLHKLHGRRGRSKLGFFISIESVTKPAREVFDRESDVLVVTLDRDDVQKLIEANGNRNELLKQFHTRDVV